MRVQQRLSGFLVGEGTLPIQCARVLLERGHEVHGVISADPQVRRWADETNVPHTDPSDDVEAFLRRRPFDYLFCIVNPLVLSWDVLALPRRYTINYHDGPLPRYAGMHATSWALLNREPNHGITWHMVVEQVDGGHCLKQRSVAVAPDETAFTLNAKCYEAAIEAFKELVEELAEGRETPRPQDPSGRTYFALHRRPSAGCTLGFDRPAGEIVAQVRALDFGPQPNPLGLPKLALGEDFVLVSGVEALDTTAGAPPGTVVRIDAGGLVVCAADRLLAVRTLRTIEGKPIPIPEAAARFGLREGSRLADLEPSRAERITERNAALCHHEPFWVTRLGSLQPVALPYGERRAPRPDPAYALRLPVAVPEAMATAFEGEPERADPAEIVLAAFAAFLARVGGTHRFDLGYSDPDLRAEVEGMEGLFASQVPLRLDLDDGWSFTAAVRSVRDQLKRTRGHGTYARDVPARYPALRSMPDLWTGQALPVAVLWARSLDDVSLLAGNRLALILSTEGPECQIAYDAGVVEEGAAERLARQLAGFLRAAVAEPHRRVADLPLLTEDERRQVLVGFNNTRADFPRDQCLHALFEAQVGRTPDAVAVVSEGERLTYRQLNGRANQLAHHLRRLGVGPDVLVGVCVNRSEEMMVAVLGVLKAGGAYLPMDPAYPRDRLALMLEDSRVPVVLSQEGLLGVLPEQLTRVVRLDSDWDEIARQSADDPAAGVVPENLAYTIYTSGSTGRPKGVQVEHRSVINVLSCIRRELGLTASDTLLAVTTLSFDIAAMDVFLPLTTGSRVEVVRREVAADGYELLRKLEESGATFMQATPATWWMLLDAGWKGGRPLTVISTGEALPRDLAEPLLKRCTALWNLYGPTETTIWSALHRVDSGDGPVPIGRPLDNTTFYLLDERLQPVPIGVAGEAYIGGDGVARGYLNRPGLTAERYTPDPFGSEPGARLYRTGDLARHSPDGTIECLGRTDHQVKVRGFRIEPGEVEAALANHPSVRQAVVVARAEQPGAERLVAYLVADPPLPSVADLRGLLARSLPEFMVPSAFVFLDSLPRTANGKLDRRALPAPDRGRDGSDDGLVEPRDRVEAELRPIWEGVLGVRPIGVRDSFFELGGHSLSAMRLLAQIEKAFGRRVPMATLFQGPTIEQLACALRGEGTAPPSPQVVPIRQGGTALPNGETPRRNPFFWIGNEFPGGDLGPDQPLAMINLWPALYDTPDIGLLCEQFLSQIRAIQPSGPYLLGGFCYGGLAAFEVASRLKASGEGVRLLAMVHPEPEPHLLSLRLRLARRLLLSIRYPSLLLRYVVRRLRGSATGPGKAPPGRPENEPTFHELAMKSLERHVRRPFDGSITLIVGDQLTERFLPRAYWGPLARGEVVVHTIPAERWDELERSRDVAVKIRELIANSSGSPTQPAGAPNPTSHRGPERHSSPAATG
jgi:amino acid adenylation domain-containing protein